jgi:arsenite-transporting ATPase
MKSVFFTGKGGVGKSSLSAAAAWQLAEQGNRVLATSFDPAHNLGDIFDEQLSHRITRYKKTSLYLQEIDLEKSAQEYLKSSVGILEEVYSYTRAFNMDKYFKVLRYSPGVEEYAALVAMEHLFRRESENFDYIVIDTPPTGLTLRILALPKVTLAWLDRLIQIRLQILDKRYTIHNITGKHDGKETKLAYTEEEDTVMRKLREMVTRYETVQSFLQSPDNNIALVCNPDVLSLKESQRLVTGTKELELPLRTLFVNKVTSENADAADRVEKDLLDEIPDVELKRVPLFRQDTPECYIMDTDLTGPLGLTTEEKA